MPRKLEGIKSLRDLLDEQEGTMKMLAEIKAIPNMNLREKLLGLFNVIMSLWAYWNITHDEIAEGHIQYYEQLFFDLLAEGLRLPKQGRANGK